MSGLETAIRNALEKSDRSNAEVRARIYQSSRQALEAGLRKQGIDDQTVVAQQRQRLENLIHAIETEERNRLLDVVEDHVRRETQRAAPPVVEPPAVAQSAPAVAAPSIAPARRHEDEVQGAAMPVEAPVRAEPRSEPASEPPEMSDFRAERSDEDLGRMTSAAGPSFEASSLAFKPERAAKGRRKKGIITRLFIWFTLLTFIGLGGWWVYSSGLLLSPAQRDTSVPNPPPSVESEDFDGRQSPQEPTLAAGRGFSDAWQEVFNADRGNAGLQPGSLSKVENVATGGGKAVRVTSQSADAAGNIAITVPAEVLREMAGKSSTISITLQSGSNGQSQVSVSCDFGTLGDCSRHRFTATQERADMLINVSFDRTMAPNAPGRIFINSDIDGTARPINLYSVRILPGQ
ncbi:hypothetical protein ACSV5G_18850 [Agrobacterium cavarae]|uniref:Biotin transporter BioY n=1 Tax=Rhizobium rhizogenes TaxID=359 RepID=A0AA92C2Y1_RHIRH|nr:hypothetical protein [Rhizobium rhizogenes]PVE53988.1 hypothetical protein DC430_12080 [Rhizobium rhizogenes]PVE66479.1 hypothetical protein DC415_08695 [Agrobacterium tumefaciens]PVE76467.1 hypothetical protein DCP16_08695 [Sphingomonas sp. TPD3009]